MDSESRRPPDMGAKADLQQAILFRRSQCEYLHQRDVGLGR